MRYFIIILLCTTSVCLAQESYHDDEFGFTFEIPSEWSITLEDEFSDKVKNGFKKHYSSKTLLMLNPPDIEAPKTPFILIQGKKLIRSTTSEAIATLKKTGKEEMTKSAEYLAKGGLGRKANRYRQIEVFSDYNSSKKLAIAKILYQHKNDNTYLLAARAQFVGLQRVIDFQGCWRGDSSQQFWQDFNDVVDSFEFDQDTAPKNLITAIPQEIKEMIALPRQAKGRPILKWIGYIIGTAIVLSIIKKLFFD